MSFLFFFLFFFCFFYFSGLSNRIMRKIFSHWRLEPVYPDHLHLEQTFYQLHFSDSTIFRQQIWCKCANAGEKPNRANIHTEFMHASTWPLDNVSWKSSDWTHLSSFDRILWNFSSIYIYSNSRTSIARIQMTSVQWLIRTCLWVSTKFFQSLQKTNTVDSRYLEFQGSL